VLRSTVEKLGGANAGKRRRLDAPVVTTAGFAFGLTLLRWRVRPLGSQFTRNYAWPLLGCAVGAAVVYPFGPMLIVFGMFAAGTLAVAIREAWLLRRGRNDERLG
jgi:hypothetical protein